MTEQGLRHTVIDFLGLTSAKAISEEYKFRQTDVQGCLDSIHTHLMVTFLDPKELDAVIEIPRLEHFRFKHGHAVVRSRKAKLAEVKTQIEQAKEWLVNETQYLYDNCVGHTYDSAGDGDGSSQPWCRDCGAYDKR